MRARLFFALVPCLALACGASPDDEASSSDADVTDDGGGGGPLDAALDAPSASDSAPSLGEVAVDSGAPAGDAGTRPRSAGCGTTHAEGFQCFTETFGGASRKWCIDVPKGYDPNKAQAIVFGLHGCGGSAEGAHSNTASQVTAGAGEFLFVYPAALGSCWDYNGGNVDVDWIKHVIERVEAQYCIAHGRVFADGMSSGGMMTSRLVCSSIALGGAAISLNYSCGLSRPMWIYGGTADSYYSSYIVPGRDGWIAANGCSKETKPLPSGPCVEYQGCKQRTIWCSEDKGHVWPNAAWTSQIVDLFRAVP